MLLVKQNRGEERDEVHNENPLPVQIPAEFQTPAFHKVPYAADYIWRLSAEGRVWLASASASNTTVTGQTSFANTTPTFLLRVPAGTVCLPLFVNLAQTGSVAGGAVDVLIEVDDADRYVSGGTAATLFTPSRTNARAPGCSLYTTATASAGYGNRVWGATIGQDVSPAEGAVPGPYWRPEVPYFLEGPASLLVFTYAGTTGPTWYYSVGWAEWPTVGE